LWSFIIVPPEKEKSRSASTEVAIKWNQCQKLGMQNKKCIIPGADTVTVGCVILCNLLLQNVPFVCCSLRTNGLLHGKEDTKEGLDIDQTQHTVTKKTQKGIPS
jgi:hypothetical protein